MILSHRVPRALLSALAALPSALTAPSRLHAQDAELRRSVVKLYTVAKKPNYYLPWQMGYQSNSGGSGCVLEGRRILTNAHVVADQVYIQALKAGDTRKYTASVEHVSHDGELALLRVDDPAFWEGTAPIRLGELPRQRDKLAVYGFPMGGEELSITEGVVSRIEVGKYTHSQRDLLLVQTDAAINPGNSGGPVFQNGRLAGIAFQSYSGSDVENTGYLVPMPILKRFLADIQDGRYDGIPDLGAHWQKMESSVMKEFYGADPKQGGVLVTKVVPGSPADGVLLEGDVLTSLAGFPIAEDGTIPLREDLRVQFTHALAPLQMGEGASVEFLRQGQARRERILLKPFQEFIPGPRYDSKPSYFILAGLVFTPLSYDYISTWKWEDAPIKFRSLYASGFPSDGRRQVIILNEILPHDANVGYHNLSLAVVSRINGQAVASIQDVPKALERPVNGFHVIELDHHERERRGNEPDNNFGTRVILRAEAAEKATREVLARYGIPSDRSADLNAAATTVKN